MDFPHFRHPLRVPPLMSMYVLKAPKKKSLKFAWTPLTFIDFMDSRHLREQAGWNILLCHLPRILRILQQRIMDMSAEGFRPWGPPYSNGYCLSLLEIWRKEAEFQHGRCFIPSASVFPWRSLPSGVIKHGWKIPKLNAGFNREKTPFFVVHFPFQAM